MSDKLLIDNATGAEIDPIKRGDFWKRAYEAAAERADAAEKKLREYVPSEDTKRIDWLETLPCGITINADRDNEAILRTRQQPGYLRELIDAEMKRRGISLTSSTERK